MGKALRQQSYFQMEAGVEERRDENSLDSPKEQRGTDQESQEKPETKSCSLLRQMCAGCFNKFCCRCKPCTKSYDCKLNPKNAAIMFVVMALVYGGVGVLLLPQGIFTSYAQSENSIEYNTYQNAQTSFPITVKLGKIAPLTLTFVYYRISDYIQIIESEPGDELKSDKNDLTDDLIDQNLKGNAKSKLLQNLFIDNIACEFLNEDNSKVGNCIIDESALSKYTPVEKKFNPGLKKYKYRVSEWLNLGFFTNCTKRLAPLEDGIPKYVSQIRFTITKKNPTNNTKNDGSLKKDSSLTIMLIQPGTFGGDPTFVSYASLVTAGLCLVSSILLFGYHLIANHMCCC